MFLIRLVRWLFGWVRLEAEGGFPERLLNLAAREGIDLWGVRRKDIRMTACCPARQYRRLRHPARRAGMRMRVIQRRGVPFLIRRYRSRAGAAVGLACFFIVLQLFTQRIWVIQVRGNKEVPAEEILAVMQDFGVREGAHLSHLDIPELQLQALQMLPDLAWCVVNLQGSIAYIDVTERIHAPQLSEADRPSNIKALRDGRIVSVEVYTGQAMIQPGDAVVQGMLLVSGVVESTEGPIFRRSQAKILAQTERVLEIHVPLKEIKLIPQNKTILRPSLYLFTLDIPLYTSGAIEQENTLTVQRNLLTVNGIGLPVGIVHRRHELLRPVEIVRSEQEAEALAADRMEAKEKHDLSGVQILSFSDKKEWSGGQYTLTRSYHCVEDICMEEQLIVEKREN